MAEEGKSKLDALLDAFGIPWGNKPNDTPTEPKVEETTAPESTPDKTQETAPVVEDTRVAELQEELAKQTLVIERLAQRPEGTTAMPTTQPEPPEIKRSILVSASDELGKRIVHEIANTPKGQSPLEIKYINPNKWATP